MLAACARERQPNSFSARDVRLTIERGGRLVFNRRLAGADLPTALRVFRYLVALPRFLMRAGYAG